jgi:hypothetical protein
LSGVSDEVLLTATAQGKTLPSVIKWPKITEQNE